MFKANRTITAAAIYRLKPRAIARPPVAGIYFHKAIKQRMHANTKEGSTANAAIATAIGPPRKPLTTIVIMEMATPGVYVIQYLARCEIGILSRLTGCSFLLDQINIDIDRITERASKNKKVKRSAIRFGGSITKQLRSKLALNQLSDLQYPQYRRSNESSSPVYPSPCVPQRYTPHGW